MSKIVSTANQRPLTKKVKKFFKVLYRIKLVKKLVNFYSYLLIWLKNILTLEEREVISIRRLVRFFIFSVLLFVFLFALIFVSMLRFSPSHQLQNFKDEDLITVLKELQKRKLKVYIYEKTSTEVPIFHIIEQRPSAGTRVKEGRTILLTISKGKQLFAMPNYVGKNYDAVKEELEIRLLPYNRKPRIVAVSTLEPQHPNKYVLSQSLAAGEVIEGDSAIFFLVNKVAKQDFLKVENYRLQNYQKVAKKLTKQGVQVEIRQRRAEVKEQIGNIFTQSLAPGDYFDKENPTITFYVATKEPNEASAERLYIYSLVVPDKNKYINPYNNAPTNQAASNQKDSDVYLYIKLVVNDKLGKNVVIEEKALSGQKMQLPYKTLGSGSLEVFINDVLYEKKLF